MKKHLSFLKTRLLALMLFLAGCLAFGQTLATFNFNDRNLNTTAGNNPNYLLRFHNPNTTVGTASYDRRWFSTNYWTYTKQENAYYELSLKTAAYEGIQISFDGELSNSAYSTATWSVYVDYGDGNGYGTTPVGVLALENDSFLGMSDSGNLNIIFPAAANFNNNWKVKFVAHNFWDILGNNQQLRMDNLVITHGNVPKIAVEGRNTANNWANIIQGASAETFRGTYFGMVITNPDTGLDYVDRSFRVTNSGNQPLKISSMSFTGDAPTDFSVTTGLPITVPANNGTREFTIRFNPSEEGVRNALLNINSNANPSPFTFHVEGRGASCAAPVKPIRWFTGGDGLNSIADNLSVVEITGETLLTANIISGSSIQNNHTPFETDVIYRNNSDSNDNFNLFTSSNRSLFINTRSTGKTFRFADIPISAEKGVEISFNLAAVSRESGQQFGSNDYITLEVLQPGSTTVWSKEIKIYGGGDNANGSRYSFDQGGTVTSTYAGTGTGPDYVNNLYNTQSTKYNKVVLRLPDTEDFTSLSFRITGRTNNANKLWLIDDLLVSSESTVFKTYTSSGWQMNGSAVAPPNRQEKAVIDQDLNINSSNPLTACECEVNPGKSLVIQDGGVVRLTGKLINNGNFTVASDANLIQVEDGAVNSGKILVHRESPMKKNNYTYWSSPVSGQNLFGFSTGTSTGRFYWYNEADNKFYTTGLNSSSVFTPGKGYAIMAPSNYSATSLTTFDGKFTGVPNNGTKYINHDNITTDLVFPLALSSGTNKGFNLIGNPYPSNIDFEKLYALNSTKIYNTAYFWTNVDPNRPGSTNGNGSAYAGNAYAIYNGTGGVPATAPATGTGATSATPTQYIKVGQGFIVKAREGQNGQDLIFNNSIRTATGTSHFFSKENQPSKDRFWLTLTTPADNVNTILIGYIPNASNGFERDYDAPLMSVASDSFYSLLDTNKLAIQGRSYPLDTEDVVPLGTKHYESGSYTLSLGDHEGIFAGNQSIYLKDKQTGIITDLTSGSYTFSSEPGEFTNRFEIVYQSESTTLAVQNPVKESLVVYRSGNDFVIKSDDANITGVEAYDMSGRMIRKLSANSREVQLPEYIFSNGVYILKIWHGDQVSTRKIRK